MVTLDANINGENSEHLKLKPYEYFLMHIKKWKPVKLPLKSMQGLHKKCGISVQ